MLLFTIQNSDSRDPMHSARNLIGPLTNCKLLNQVTVLFEIGIVFFLFKQVLCYYSLCIVNCAQPI